MARRLLTSDATPPPTTGAPPAAPRIRWGMHGTPVKVAIAGNVVVVVLFFVAIVWRIYFSRRDQEGAAAAASPQAQGADGAVARASSSGASTPCASPRAGGLRREELRALPVFVHGSSEEEEAGNVECAVCIGELRDGDTGRLLPRCGHRFHAECVDRWLRSHVTCPLCRAVVADGGSGQPDPKVLPAV